MDCPDCYNLVKDAADDHREKLYGLNKVLLEIASKPTVIDDDEFEFKLKSVQEVIDILTQDAKAGAGGGDRTLVERLNDLNDRIVKVAEILNNSDNLQNVGLGDVLRARDNVTVAEKTIINANEQLSVSAQ